MPDPVRSGEPWPGPAPAPGRRRRVLLVAAGAGVLVAAAIAAAFALFTSQATVAHQDVGTATIQIEAGTAAESQPIDVADLLPGDELSTAIEVSNTGDAGVRWRVSLPVAEAGDADLTEALEVTVRAGGEQHTRTLTSWQTGTWHAEAPLAAGSTDSVEVVVELPLEAGNDLQGTATSFSVQIDAVQEKNTDASAGWESHLGPP